MIYCSTDTGMTSREKQNKKTSVTHSPAARVPHFDVNWDLLLNRRTATWNLFVKYYMTGDAAP